MKYVLCPRENMNDQCGKKVHKFDVNDKKKEYVFNAPWYKPRDKVNNPTDFPVYKFDRLGLCNYVFVMPDNAEIDSSFEIKFNGGDRDKNRNT